jgi:hypothetical protein
MTLTEAKEELEKMDPQIVRDGGLVGGRNLRPYNEVGWLKGESLCFLEGHFTVREVMALATWMEEHSK